ncbi:MAG: hypothetical protein KQI62_09585 [Deltaproteobacteria bacterium]|nr:hypothetical protein [Deltaproteobacteria bacterium]
MAQLNPELVRDMLIKQWMTHDAMWLAHSIQEVGVEVANRLNRKAVGGMARVEAKRLARLAGIEKVRNLATLRYFMDQAYRVVGADWMGLSYSFQPPRRMRVDMEECFSFLGVSRLEAIDHYDCGVFTRVEGWLKELSLEFTVEPKVSKCAGSRKGRCHREYTFACLSG